MSYGELLERFAERCATGRGGRYDDGAWGHPTLARRARWSCTAASRRGCTRRRPARSRCPSSAQPTSTTRAAALAAFCDAFPAARTTLLHPADAQYFLEVCDRPGKPVPFVPVLDGEVRRWYMADALWQAQDDRLDADGVFVIPGPRSVAGIARADEPVGELLARFEAEAIARVLAAGRRAVARATGSPTRARSRRRWRARSPGTADPSPRCAARRRCSSPSPAGCARGPTRCGASSCPATRCVPCVDDAGRLARVEVLPAGAVGERLEIAADGAQVVVTAVMPALDGPPAALVTRWRAAGAGTFVAADGDAGTIAFARRGARRAAAAPCPRTRSIASRRRGRARPGWPARTAPPPAPRTTAAGLDLALTLAWPAVAGLLSSAPFVRAARPARAHRPRDRARPGVAAARRRARRRSRRT